MSEQKVDALGNEVKRLRGFAAMDPEARKAACRRGGLKAQELGKAHKFNSLTAKEAGSRGGKCKKIRGTKLSVDKRIHPKKCRQTLATLAKNFKSGDVVFPKEMDPALQSRPQIVLEPLGEAEATGVGDEVDVGSMTLGEVVGDSVAAIPEEGLVVEAEEKATLAELLVPENAEMLKECMTQVGEEMMAKGLPKITYQSDAEVEKWNAGAVELTPEQEALLAELKGGAEEDRDL